VSFDVAADAYDGFMGRYSSLLAPAFAAFAGVSSGDRVLDVGCGPGALTGELVRIAGADRVAAVDPSAPFVAAAGKRHPGVDVRLASAEALPHPDSAFDATLAQLVVHFLADPVAGLREMTRVTRPGGVVAACVWDHAGGRGPLGTFWSTARELDPDATDEGDLPGAREGHLEALLAAAGLEDVQGTVLAADRRHESFDEWWEPYTRGVGPAGAYVAGLDEVRRQKLQRALRTRLGAGPFAIEARCWAARGLRPADGGDRAATTWRPPRR
jgi:SAM-dependent methyltransferase